MMRLNSISLLNRSLQNFAKSYSFSSTVDPKEIKNFSKVSDWWDFTGSQQGLKAYNFLRVDYIKRILSSEKNLNISSRSPLQGLNVIDVGCGGGILCEVMNFFWFLLGKYDITVYFYIKYCVFCFYTQFFM